MNDGREWTASIAFPKDRNPMTHPVLDEMWTRMMRKALDCEAAANEYPPLDSLRLVIIGESPPIKPAYFYIPCNLGKKNNLPAMVFRALFRAEGSIDEQQYRQYLKDFQKARFFLTDLCRYPVNSFESTFRMAFIQSELQHFELQFKKLSLSPSCECVLVLPKGTLDELNKKRNATIREALDRCGISAENRIAWGNIENWLVSFQARNAAESD